MLQTLQESVGIITVGTGESAMQFEFVLKPVDNKKAVVETGSKFPVPLGVTLDDETRLRIKNISRICKVPRSFVLDRVLQSVSGATTRPLFASFCESGAYEEPRRIGGKQTHFRLSSQMSNELTKLCWECCQGNKSRLARLAIAHFAESHL